MGDRPAHPPFSVQERDVDLLILGQLHISPSFVTWIGERAGIAGARLASARHSVSTANGETDVSRSSRMRAAEWP